MSRELLRAQIEERIGDRQLIWFGTRGEDVESATDLAQLSAAFSLIGTYRRRPSIQATSLEDLSGVRPDLDAFDVDAHPRDPAVDELRRALLRTLARPSVLFTYRPSAFLSAIAFARSDRCDYLGLFSGHQSAFEHKPWVESSLASLGIPHVPWTYIADTDQLEAARLLQDGPIMLRRSRTTGGIGLTRVDDESLLASSWPDEDEAFVSVAPFVSDAVPVNVTAVVWSEGVTVHPLSLQLIGIPECTARPFGYCGNDFAAAAGLDRPIIESIETSVRRIGEWLRSRGYLGAFGADFMVHEGVALFTEVNPRFQGSTHLSSQLSLELGQPCVLLDHIAACLGVAMPSAPSLWELSQAAPPLSHVVVHSPAPDQRRIDAGGLVEQLATGFGLSRADVLADGTVALEPGATIARLVFRRSVTTGGFDLAEDLRRAIGENIAQYRDTARFVVERGR